MCLYPRLLKNPKYKPNKKNGGNVPVPKDVRALYVPIGCEKCIECRKQKSRAWQVRLLEDVRHNTHGKFITLTFSNEAYTKWYKEINPRLLITEKGEIKETTRTPYEIDNMIATMAMRNFLERWRRKYGKSLRHWMVTELGHEGTENIHLHGIIWCKEVKTKITGIRKRVTDRSEKGILNAVETTWNNGFVWVGKDKYSGKITNYVNEETVNYITKYVSKMDEQHKYYNSIILTSPGIGKEYTKRHDAILNKFNGKNTKEYYRNRQGFKINLPIYYRNKIYTEEEREQLWLNRLDKGERWVRGIKCTTEKEYWDQLAEARKINKLLNYQSSETDWKRKYYEEQVRLIKQAARINSTNRSRSGHSAEQEAKLADYTGDVEGLTCLKHRHNVKLVDSDNKFEMKLYIDNSLKPKSMNKSDYSPESLEELHEIVDSYYSNEKKEQEQDRSPRGSNQKGLDYNTRPSMEVNTSPLDSGARTGIKRRGVAPAVGCETLLRIADNPKWWDKVRNEAPF